MNRLYSIADNGCWEWLGKKLNTGYGVLHKDGASIPAHRWVYGVDSIPKDMELHHLCCNRGCVNPLHLQLVSRKEHIRLEPRGFAYENSQKTRCKNGHRFDESNTLNWRGHRFCKACNLIAAARYRTKKNALKIREQQEYNQ